MDPAPRRTSRGDPRCTSPDGVKGKKLYLIKMVPLMRLTYQVAALSRAAEQNKRKLIIVLPRGSDVSSDLRTFISSRRWVKVEHVEER